MLLNKTADIRGKIKILFLCTGNSCRSQMAEGWGRFFHGEMFDFYSAGIQKHGMNARAVSVMKEVGIDISAQYSKTLEELGPIQFDFVFTVCGDAHEHCPYFPGKTKVIHVGFQDPPRLSEGLTDEEEILAHYRRVRDEIRDFTRTLKVAGE